MTLLANANLHLLQDGAFSSNGFRVWRGWGLGQYDGPTWNAHFYRYSEQKEGRKKYVLVCFRSLVLGCLSFLCNIKSSLQCFWSLCVLFIVMPIVARKVRSTFPGSRHVWDHGENSGFWFPCMQHRFSCSRSQCAHMPDLGNCSDFFVALPIKGICAIEQLICSHIWWWPGGVKAERDWVRKQTHLPSSTSCSYLRKIPKTVLWTDAKYMCWDFKKEITLLSISWFHTAIFVMKISEHYKDLAAFCNFGLLYICMYTT